jgi:hypothetical protein
MIPEEVQGPAPRDHNLPDGMLPLEEAIEEFDKFFAIEPIFKGKTFAERKAEFLRSAKNAYVRDRASAGMVGDVLKLAARAREKLRDARFDRSQPYRDVADALGRKAEELWDEVDTAMDGLRVLLDTWTKAEDDRIAKQAEEQEAELAAKLAAAKPAVVDEIPPGETFATMVEDAQERGTLQAVGVTPAPAPRRKKIRGDLGATVSAVDKHTYVITDVRALPDYILDAPGVREAIVSAIKSTRKVMGVPKTGVVVNTSTENQIR